MGEWSKSIGEKGERILEFIFEEILDFNSLLQNPPIECIRGIKHKLKTSNSNRTSHGIDGLVSYKSPLEDYTLDVGLISSKYTEGEYPSSLSSLFKSYIKDLAETFECFNFSKLKNGINQNFSGVNKTEIFGILTWLSNTSPLNYDLVSKVKNIQIDNELIFDKIILLDNNKVTFLYDSIYRTKEIFGHENVDYVYHNSGLNFTSLRENSYGRLFPLNYLYSDVIALRTIKSNLISLNIFINYSFDEDQLELFLSFAKNFDHLNAVNKTILHFRSYDNLLNENAVKERLVKFPNYKLDQNLEVKKFPTDFRN